MAEFDGRSELRFFYATDVSSRVLPHLYTLDFDFPDISGFTIPINFVTVDLFDWGGGEITLSAMVDGLMTLLLPFWRPTTEFSRVEWWYYEAEPSQDASFVGVYDLSLPGTAGAGTDTAAHQSTITYRTAGGGHMRQQLMETIIVSNNVQTYPTSIAIVNNLIDYMVGSSHRWCGRDDTRPIVSIKAGFGQNERLARKRFRE